MQAAPAASAERARAVFSQHFGRIRPRHLQRRQHAGDQSAAERGREQEQQDAHVELHGFDSWQRAGGKGAERHGADPGEQQADRAGEERQDDALGQGLADEARPGRAERGAHGVLGASRGGAGEDEIGDVRARDQQDEPDRPEQQPQGSFGGPADDAIGQRVGDDAERGVGRRILLAELRGDGVHLGARRLDRGPWRQAAEDDEPIGAAGPFVELVRPEEERLPELDVGRRQLELGRHHADDLDVGAVQLDGFVR